MSYSWDSSQTFFPALHKPFVVTKYDSIVEIPCLFPQDINLFGALGLSSGPIERLWREAYEASEKHFVWSVHPRVIAKKPCRLSMLDRFLSYLRGDNAELMSMSDMAESMRAKDNVGS